MKTASYNYSGFSADGSTKQGTLQAVSNDDAYRRIQASGLTPISIKLASAASLRRKKSKKVSLRELSAFTHQFSILVEARIPISDGLRSIAEEESNPGLKWLVNDVASGIDAGNTITESVEKHRHVLGDVYIETLNAAEQSGNIVSVLARLAEMLEREVAMRSQVKSALLYPLCVVCALILAMIFLMIAVVPKFATMFESRGVALPLPTRLLVGMSHGIVSYWWIILLAGAGGYMLVRRFIRSSSGSSLIDGILSKIPGVSSILQAAALSRFAHVFGLSLSSGLGLIDCIEMSGRASGRSLLLRDSETMTAHISQGGRLMDVLKSCGYITPFARRLLSAGEQSAELPRMCEIIAKHYDQELQHLTKNIATLIEPIMVAGLAGIVLFVALSIFLPLWDMMNVMGG